MPIAVKLVTSTSTPVPAVHLVEDVLAQRADELLGGLVLRAGLGHGEPPGDRAVVRRLRAPHEGDPVGVLHGGRDRAEGGLVGALGDLRHEEQRAVEAGAEALGEQVVGLSGVGVLRVVALVGEPEADAEHGQGEHDQDRQAADGRRPRVVLHEPAVAVPERLPRRLDLPGRQLPVDRPEEGADDEHQQRQDEAEGGRLEPEPEADEGDGDEAGGDEAPVLRDLEAARRRGRAAPAAA